MHGRIALRPLAGLTRWVRVRRDAGLACGGGMQRYEYRVIPAPRRGEKARGAKTAPERFGVALTTLMNQMGQDGWDYLRADTLPCEERVGLTGRSTSFQSMLVFRRDMAVDDTVHAQPHGAEPATMPPLTSDPAGGPATGVPPRSRTRGGPRCPSSCPG